MFKIKNRLIGPGHSTYIIAELSCNHNGDIDKAIEIIKEAKNSGADAVKIQTYTGDTITLKCDKSYFKLDNTEWDDKKTDEKVK